jgi:hypothetical protein
MKMIEESLLTIANLLPFIIISAVIFYGLFKFLVARRWNKHKADTVDKWEAEGIEYVRGPAGGQFGGLESMGEKQIVRGVGFVVMTENDLRVTRATPPGTWCVTYKQIKGVTIQPAFMGHTTQKTPFIVVRFVKDGQKDKLAFLVKNYVEWAEELAETAGVNLKYQRKKDKLKKR